MITLTQAREEMAALEASWGSERPHTLAPDIRRVQGAIDAALGRHPAQRLGYAQVRQMVGDLEAIARSPKLRRLPEPQRRAILLEVNRITLDLAAQVREAMRPPARPAVLATTYPPRRRSPLPSEWLR
jgi:hypothetical protein